MYLFKVLTYHSTTIIKMSNNDYILPKAYASKPLILLVNHSLEKKRFALNENVQPLLVFSFFTSSNFTFPLMNALVFEDIVQGIHKGKSKVARKKNKKDYVGFLFT